MAMSAFPFQEVVVDGLSTHQALSDLRDSLHQALSNFNLQRQARRSWKVTPELPCPASCGDVHYPDLLTPPSQSISLQWTYRDGCLVNLPVSLLVKGDIVVLRPGQEAPTSLRGLQEKEHVVLERGDIFCHFSSPPSPLDGDKPCSHHVLQPQPFRVTKTPIVESVQRYLELGDQRPVSVLDNERFTAQTILEKVVAPLVLVNGILPLLPLTFPLLWLLLSLYGAARVLRQVKKPPVLCCVDKQGILSFPEPSVDKVLFFTRNSLPPQERGTGTADGQQKQSSMKVLSLSQDRETLMGVQFDDPRWQHYSSSLRPLGLGTLLGLCNSVAVANIWQLTDHLSNVALFRSCPSCPPIQMPWGTCELAKVLGFSSHGKDAFQQQMSFAVYNINTSLSSMDMLPWHLPPVTRRKLPLSHAICLIFHDTTTGTDSESIDEDDLQMLVGDQIFLGLISTQYQARPEMVRLVAGMDDACIRFVWFSLEEEVRSKAKLPKGIENVRPHLENIDNVPLLVPLFTDCTPDTMCEMVKIMQEHGEVTCCLGSGLTLRNYKVLLQSDISIALEPLFPSPCGIESGCPSVLVPHSPVGPTPSCNPLLQLASVLCGMPCAVHLTQQEIPSIICLIKQVLGCVCQLPPPLGTTDVICLSCISFPMVRLILQLFKMSAAHSLENRDPSFGLSDIPIATWLLGFLWLLPLVAINEAIKLHEIRPALLVIALHKCLVLHVGSTQQQISILALLASELQTQERGQAVV
ncbi:TMM94 protein, partial [Polypterus senegalus]